MVSHQNAYIDMKILWRKEVIHGIWSLQKPNFGMQKNRANEMNDISCSSKRIKPNHVYIYSCIYLTIRYYGNTFQICIVVVVAFHLLVSPLSPCPVHGIPAFSFQCFFENQSPYAQQERLTFFLSLTQFRYRKEKTQKNGMIWNEMDRDRN